MIHSNSELYLEIRKIIKTLKSALEEKYAQDLEEALAVSTVPTEILGECYLILKKLEDSMLAKDLNVNTDIKNALTYIQQVL